MNIISTWILVLGLSASFIGNIGIKGEMCITSQDSAPTTTTAKPPLMGERVKTKLKLTRNVYFMILSIEHLQYLYKTHYGSSSGIPC